MYSYIWKTASPVVEEGYKTSFEIEGIVPLMWREHCLECAMPLCYKTCDLYAPRMDKRCLRFENGIVPVNYKDNEIRGAEIFFRRWAKLQTNLTDNLSVISLNSYSGKERQYDSLANCVRKSCDVIHQYRMSQVYASLVERYNTAQIKKNSGSLANCFLAVINNKGEKVLTLLLEIMSDDKSIYKTSFVLNPGWNEFRIPLSDFNLPSTESKENFLRAYLNDNETGRLQFRYFDFVRTKEKNKPKPAKKVKCVAWDLDNTVWNGVIGDVGKENVQINNDAVNLMKQLDERGILQTIVSKNTYDIVWPYLEELGIAQYFLYPAINWGRKSMSMVSIAKELNINIDTFALIDDSDFERREVSTELSQVRVYDVSEINDILNKPEFDVAISPETKARRASYQTEAKRKKISASWDGDYNSFLRSCEMKMRLFHPTVDNGMERCLELINRSNQYNISGVRYEKDEFMKLLADDKYACYGIAVSDKYGDYGIVGFASVIKKDDNLQLKDFVMSCRVAQKKVERAFVNEIISNVKDGFFVIELKKTERNVPLQEEFKKMDMILDEDSKNYLKLHLNLAVYKDSLNDGIFEISKEQ